MKKNIFKYAALSAIALIGFAACEKKDEVKLNQNNTENPYSDEEILNAVKFVGQGGLNESAFNKLKVGTDNDVKLMKITLHSQKSGCTTGFAVCHLWIGSWQVFYQVPVDDNTLLVEYDGKADLSDMESIKLFLSEKTDLDMTKVSLPVDGDIVIINETKAANKVERIVVPQQSAFNPNLGKYGGFELKVDKLSDYMN